MGIIKINNIIYGSNNASDIIYKDITVEEKLDTILIFDINDNGAVVVESDVLTYGHIVDNLNSTESNKILSAKQGKVLNDKIDNIDLSYLENDISNNADNISLLDKKITNVNNDLNNKITNNTNNISSLADMNNIFLNLTLDEVTPLAVCRYLRDNIAKEKFFFNGVHFNVIVNDIDFFSGDIYGDNYNSYWGLLEQRGSSPNTHNFYKYFSMDGADTVTPFNNIKSGEAWLRSCRKITTHHNYTGGMTGCFYINDLDFSDIDSFVFSYSIGTSTKASNPFMVYNDSVCFVNVDPSSNISNQTVNINNTTLPCTVRIDVSYQGTNYLTIHSYTKHGVVYTL